LTFDGHVKKRSVSKIFENEEFGFHKITVERPLRLNLAFTDERIARLENELSFQKLATSQKHKEDQRLAEIEAGKERQEEIRIFLKGLAKIHGEEVFVDREQFLNQFKSHERKTDLRLDPAERKAILSALSQRDEKAGICRDNKGNPEPDPEIRDTEIVPLTEEIDQYFKREVLPHVGDAWIDRNKTKIGYEIPLNRHFYVYEPPRVLEAIEREIKELESEILGLLRGLML
jgi:type I restriction enzyme M protein